jgi:CheY-like chemotaxis protein/HPt (histidine-containing phosphotransfer) domain-containing protein
LLVQAKVGQDPFSVAILDMQMPGMDGKSLGRAIQSDPRLRDTRLVMCLSLGQAGRDQDWEEIGFAAALSKPVRRQQLQDVLEGLVGGRKIVPSCVPPGMATLSDLSRARILVAEDNIVNQRVAVGILQKLGISADVAANGAEAVRALEILPYDLVLMDMQMPQMDGLQAARSIRDPQSRVLDRRVPIIAMTANAMRSDREKCLQAGMDDYLTKPIDVDALIAALEKWLKPKGQGLQPVEHENDLEKIIVFAPAGETPVFNRLALMNQVMNDEVMAWELIDIFIQDMPDRIVQLNRHVAAGEASQVQQQAHNIRGSSATVGAQALSVLAKAIEQAGKAGDMAFVSARLAELDAQFAALKKAVTADKAL